MVSAIAFLCACSQPSKANDSSNGSSEYSAEYSYDTNPTEPETSKDSTKQMDPATVARILNSDYSSDPEDAYEEGVAQAEEDRLAGHPGANYADDYDDDDENEAYEEGYEDE